MLHLQRSDNIYTQTKKLQVQGCPVLQHQMSSSTLEESSEGTSSFVQRNEIEENRGGVKKKKVRIQRGESMESRERGRMREQEEEERRNLGFNVCNPWSQEKENKLKDELNSGGSGFTEVDKPNKDQEN